MLDNGRSIDAVTRALAKDAVAHEHEFVLKQTLIPFDYEINDQGRWTDSGGKTIEELTDPDDVGADRLDRVLAAEKAMMGDSSIQMAAVASPDLGYGRNYVYLYSRGEGNTIRALAVEFQGGDEALGNFFRALGIAGKANVSESDDFEKPLLFARAITAGEILTQAKNSADEDDQNGDYIKRLTRDVSVFPLILKERERQVEQMATLALEHMLSEENVREGLAAAVYGAIAMTAEEGESTVVRVASDTQETILGVMEYIRKHQNFETRGDVAPAHDMPTQTVYIEEVLRNEDSVIISALTHEPASETYGALSEGEKVEVWKQTAREIFHVSETESEELLIQVTHVWETSSRAKDILDLAGEIVPQHPDIAVPAWLFALDVLTVPSHQEEFGERLLHTEEHVTPLMDPGSTQTQKIVREIEETTVSVPQEATLMAYAFIENLNDDETIDAQINKLIEIADFVDVFVLTETILFIKDIEALPPETQEEAVVREQERTTESIAFLTEEIQGIAIEMKKEPNEEISQLSIAFALWLMLKLMNYSSSLEAFAAFLKEAKSEGLTEQNEGIRLAFMKKKRPEGLVQRETGQWLLLSIIWHLAMIREQGMRSINQQAAQTKNSKKRTYTRKNTPIVPFDGVIFAYGS